MRIGIGFLVIALSGAAVADDSVEEIVVTARKVDVSESLPGRTLRKQADNLLLRVSIYNDSRDAELREREIHATLLGALRKASRDASIELSTVTDSGFVIRMTEANHRIELGIGARPDTSRAEFRVRRRVPTSIDDGEAAVLELRRFVADLKMTGRTEVRADGDVEVSIVNPEQYRAAVLQLMADDISAVTGALGEEYRVIVTGADRPVQWVRAGSLGVALFVPYSYVVVPETLGSYVQHMVEDY